MKKIFNYSLFFILLSFVFINCVNAECSYQERKQLLNEAKSVDISVEPIFNEDATYSFKFSVVGMTENIFFKYYNLNNAEETFVHYADLSGGIYNFIDNNTFMIYNYNFVFYSSNPNCVGYELYTTKVKKPMYNIYSENEVCGYDSLKDYEYCKKFLEKDYHLTNEKFIEYTANKLYETNNTSTDNNIEEPFIKKYYVYYIILIIVLLITGISIYSKKKKSKL